MQKIKITRIDYYYQLNDGKMSSTWTAHVAGFSQNDAIKTIESAIKKKIIPTTISEICQLDALSNEVINLILKDHNSAVSVAKKEVKTGETKPEEKVPQQKPVFKKKD